MNKLLPGSSFLRRITLKKISNMALCLCLILLFLLTFTSCSRPGAYTLENNGDTVELQIGETMELKLESNPTTGYSWFPDEDTDNTIIKLTSTEYNQTKKAEKLVGSGGFEYFFFEALSSGSTELVLNYERPWEEDEEPVNTFRLDIEVK
jgi:predicted secreted protein